jgi:hypothetical protein
MGEMQYDVTHCKSAKIADTRNRHPYVISYVSAKSGKMFGLKKKKKLVQLKENG